MNNINANYEDSLRAKLLNNTIYHESIHSRVFHFGQVIKNTDPQNINRVQVRIPIIDDVFYVSKTKEQGDAALPFCFPISHRFIDIPEVNSIVIVSVLDPKTPYYGRVFFDTITELSTADIFNRTTPEANSLSTWDNVEKGYNIKLNSKPTNPSSFDAKANVDYRTGIRGKGKNKFELQQTSSIWTQNEGDSNNYSFIQLTNNIDIKGANNLNITSVQGKSTNYHPVFHSPLYDYLKSNIQMIQKIVLLLNTVPAISPVGPCTAGPSATTLTTQLESLVQDFQKLKSQGNSEKIFIN